MAAVWVVSCVLGVTAALFLWRLAATARTAYNVLVAAICVVTVVALFLGKR